MWTLRAAIRIDMTLTDEAVLRVIRERLGKEPGRLSLEEISRAVGCHTSTARRSVRRLRGAGRLNYQTGGGYGKPSTFEVVENAGK